MARLVRWLVGIAAVAGVAAALSWALWPAPVPVDLATVERGDLVVAVSDEGVTRIREVYTVSAPVTGQVARSPLEEGDAVTAGETLVATLAPGAPDPLDLRTRRERQAAVEAAEAAVDLAEAELKEAEARRDFAANDLKRAMSLAARGTITQRQLEERQLEVSATQAALDTARAALAMRRKELASARARLLSPGQPAGVEEFEPVRVLAPTSGIVISVPVESEQVVAAGTPLVEIGDPDDLEVVVDLLSTEAVAVAPGARGWIDGWGGPRVPATVRRVAPAARTEISALGIEEQRVEVILDLQDGDGKAGRLGHNYRVIAHVVVAEVEDGVLVPLSALFRDEGAWAAFVVADGVARQVRLQLGERNDRLAEVLSGLEPGDVVVTHPGDAVADGVRVAPRRIAPAG